MAMNMGSTYRILGYQPSVNSAWRQKLLTMGMLPGAVIEVIRVRQWAIRCRSLPGRVSLAVRQRDLDDIILEEIV
ncbi:FeoA domain-containing protein [Pantoea agglomerans]|uniref:FeoA domain-containing protein n=1 Tax=Enterobacter agglomerans TaxID=549 RepID=UPI002E328487|nr:FeoA domain-containing protein [Pantoea agglomerans]